MAVFDVFVLRAPEVAIQRGTILPPSYLALLLNRYTALTDHSFTAAL